MFKKEKNNDYLTIKESREIIKYNIRQMKYYEAQKRIKRSESEYTAPMHDENNVVEIDDLHTSFFTDRGTVKSVDGVSFSIPKNKIVGVVGESGCGKSVTSLSIMQLVAAPQGQITGGSIRFNSDKLGYNEEGRKLGFDVTKMPTEEMHKIRGQDITMIFQEPMTSLNPVMRVGLQVRETLLLHRKISPQEAKAEVLRIFRKVGISEPERRYNCYPHELSGGLRQRVMIAMAMICRPKLVIADEPTTALDVTVEAQILQLMRALRDETSSGIVIISHNLGVIAQLCDYVYVMYAGRVVEQAETFDLFAHPMHPYTAGLMAAVSSLARGNGALEIIPGTVPNLLHLPVGCSFSPRCAKCGTHCGDVVPELREVSSGHLVRCINIPEVRL